MRAPATRFLWLGPLILGYGLREGGGSTAFLEIGQRF